MRMERTDPLYVAYHDAEWGVPVHDDRTLFEFLILEGAQAGLSWSTILKKRKDTGRPLTISTPGRSPDTPTMTFPAACQPRIIRNRLKINAAISNAGAVLRIQEEFGGFDRYVWRFVNGKPVQNAWERMGDIPAAPGV